MINEAPALDPQELLAVTDALNKLTIAKDALEKNPADDSLRLKAHNEARALRATFEDVSFYARFIDRNLQTQIGAVYADVRRLMAMTPDAHSAQVDEYATYVETLDLAKVAELIKA